MPPAFRAELVDDDLEEYCDVKHGGFTYVVAEPGEEFSVAVNRAAGAEGDYQVSLTVDGRDVGYTLHFQSGLLGEQRFPGFYKGRGSDFQAWQFGSTKDGADALTVRGTEAIMTGCLVLEAHHVKRTRKPAPLTSYVQPAQRLQLPKGKKPGLAPSLYAKAAEPAPVSGVQWCDREWETVGQPVWRQEIRFGTADALVMCGALNVNNASHHRMLATCTIPTVREALALFNCAGRKDQGGSTPTHDKGGIDVIDLTRGDTPPPTGLLAPGTKAACDLTGEDGAAPSWTEYHEEPLYVA